VVILLAFFVVIAVVLGIGAWRTHLTWTSVDRQARRFHERKP
jgi:hypothetical protein